MVTVPNPLYRYRNVIHQNWKEFYDMKVERMLKRKESVESGVAGRPFYTLQQSVCIITHLPRWRRGLRGRSGPRASSCPRRPSPGTPSSRTFPANEIFIHSDRFSAIVFPSSKNFASLVGGHLVRLAHAHLCVPPLGLLALLLLLVEVRQPARPRCPDQLLGGRRHLCLRGETH